MKLYGEVFVFENFDGDKYFKIIANKYPIKSSKYFDLQSVYGYGGGYRVIAMMKILSSKV
ncbi:hypothetical protein [Campylobacter armoricus]|uniref:hypothetical protein n=1 Tax=Campylobacter armoricus TaxID=2505970 RepID=UPI001F44026F|nr:hypothetical protein [Campylobacter armoricus]